MTESERSQKLESYRKAPDHLTEMLQHFPKKAWQFRPTPDAWTIHELVVHLADAEASGFVRCRKAIAEPGSAVTAYDEERWTATLRYHEQDPEDARQLFRLQRVMTYKLLTSLPESIWSQTIEHPENGTMTLDDWLISYDDHANGHIQQIQQNYAEWSKRH